MDENRKRAIDVLISQGRFTGGAALDATLEELLYAVHASKGSVGKEVVLVLAERMKNTEEWYVLWSDEFEAPFIHQGRVYIFTEENIGNTVCAQIKQKGFGVTLRQTGLLDENVFDLSLRYGVSGISVNKGHGGAALDASYFADDAFVKKVEDGAVNPTLTGALYSFVSAINSQNDDYEGVAYAFFRQLSKAQLLVPVSADGSFVLSELTIGGTDQQGLLVATDIEEFRTSFPLRNAKPKKMALAAIRELHKGVIVLNSAGINLTLLDDICDVCENLNNVFERIYVSGRESGKISEDAQKLTEEIMTQGDIAFEFYTALIEGEIPVVGAVMVRGYTADMVSRTMASSIFETYLYLARLRTRG